ncbi:MAG: aminotransferase class V-fold PLP-dependent enzyme [Betaproteobacteria bacterium]|nr:aminotransferase class V-fold PLP-dependent enzyme [Pseudomonadota bacterium]NBO11712.1 aminotransferase class V-fold PLP-dependent enzyme [Betaproteobacteria bacterium]NBO43698.1 aminotransferase class V-fold PLP-dependent enzyme [Betaproteobacteria bacterium]NBP10393.1 aminotransferase class V-fold PLP-dependent enzyme [Betaproteobacteria bacterium]NBP60813.1 aminotransferase class V-fold PLP-dependent enzyme [Betaproteobacteria bacterium]
MRSYPNNRIPGARFLHAPGPTRIPDEVLDAMHRQSIDLADTRLDTWIKDCEAGMQALVGTRDAEVYLYAANGHGAWEVAIANVLAEGDLVLIPSTGHFSEGWALQTEALDRRVLRTPWREGYPIDPDEIETILRKDKEGEIKAVFVVQTDTSTGITSDVQAIREAIDRAGHPALYVVDVVSSLAATPFHMDAMGVNLVVGGSQKGLMLPPGLGFVVVDARANQASVDNPSPKFYWDWTKRTGTHAYRKFCGTPPLQMLMGLRAALELLQQEGLEQVFARHRRLAGAVFEAIDAWSAAGAIDFFCQDKQARSVAVTAVTVQGFDPEAIRNLAREQFQVAMAGGLGPMAGKVFRIGHLGDMNEPTILGALAGIEAAMLRMAVPIGRDALPRAIDFLASQGS